MAESGVFERGSPPAVPGDQDSLEPWRQWCYQTTFTDQALKLGLSWARKQRSCLYCRRLAVWSALSESLNRSLPSLCCSKTRRENIWQRRTDTNTNNEAFAPASRFVSLLAITHKANLIKKIMKNRLRGRGLTRVFLWRSHYTLFFNNPFPRKFHKLEQVLLQKLLYFFITWQ